MDSIVDVKIAENISNATLHIKAVTFNIKKPYKYISGIFSPMYTDNRLIMSYPEAWEKVIEGYLHIIKTVVGVENIDVLSGTATAGIPHAAALAYILKKPMVYVRSSKKEHGKENLIEGTFTPGQKVLIIEDLISTGKSTAGNVEAVREAGGIVDSCVAITTSTVNAYDKTFEDMKVKLLTITNVSTTLDVAAREKYITDEDKKSVSEFLADSLNWGKNHGFI